MPSTSRTPTLNGIRSLLHHFLLATISLVTYFFHVAGSTILNMTIYYISYAYKTVVDYIYRYAHRKYREWVFCGEVFILNVKNNLKGSMLFTAFTKYDKVYKSFTRMWMMRTTEVKHETESKPKPSKTETTPPGRHDHRFTSRKSPDNLSSTPLRSSYHSPSSPQSADCHHPRNCVYQNTNPSSPYSQNGRRQPKFRQKLTIFSFRPKSDPCVAPSTVFQAKKIEDTKKIEYSPRLDVGHYLAAPPLVVLRNEYTLMPYERVFQEHRRQKAVFEWQQEQEQQRQKAEQQAEYQRLYEATLSAQELLQSHEPDYRSRVSELGSYGQLLFSVLTQLINAMDHCNEQGICFVASELNKNVLKPVNNIFQAMNQDIPLLLDDANKIRAEWPIYEMQTALERFNNAHDAGHLHMEIQGLAVSMNHLWQSILQSIDAVESADSLIEKVIASQMGWAYQPQGHAQPQYQQAPTEVSYATQNFASFTEFVNASKAATNQQPQVPSTTVDSPISGSSSSTNDQQPMGYLASKILSYIKLNVLDFEAEVKELLNKNEKVMPRPCRALTDQLEYIRDVALGETGIFDGSEDSDCARMKTEVKKVIKSIANLTNAKEKNTMKTRELDVVAHKVLKLWI
ncbi:hypothetical protein GQ44DRAFT_830256 [Phaeosphaeriaceae sp. PMI808]|nr:hypothetical protein GQ44DRAFT_830256 [Phaeosphaeriaceae sp. PMI808]